MSDIIITVGARNGKGGIPYRAVPANLPPDPDKGNIWFFEYQVRPDPYWRPRGTFHEKDGVFVYAGQEFASAYQALAARVASGV